MSTITVNNPFPFFTDTNGKALENGNIYIGVAGLDAKTNPITAYWDDARDIPAAQPIRTVEGYPDNGGSPSNFFTGSDYSITVEDSADVLIYSKLRMNDTVDGGGWDFSYNTRQQLADAIFSGGVLNGQIGIVLEVDAVYVIDSTTTGTLSALFDLGQDGAEFLSTRIDVKWFGATYPGDASTAINNANTHRGAVRGALGLDGAATIVIEGSYQIANRISLGGNTGKVGSDWSNATITVIAGGDLESGGHGDPDDSTTFAIRIQGSRTHHLCGVLECEKFCNGIWFVNAGNTMVEAPNVKHFWLRGISTNEPCDGMQLMGAKSSEWSNGEEGYQRESTIIGSALYLNASDMMVHGGHYGYTKIPLEFGPGALGVQVSDSHPFNGQPGAGDTRNGNTDEPIVMLAMGGANMIGQALSTEGSKVVETGVFIWDGDNNAHGTSFSQAAFGTFPLDRGIAPYANNMAVHCANELKTRTGRDVYIFLVAKTSINLESFLTATALAANGYTADDTNIKDFIHADGLTALAAVPGRTTTKFDVFLWQHGEANAADLPGGVTSVYADKLQILCEDLDAAGLIDLDATDTGLGGLPDTNTNKDDHKAAVDEAILRIPRVQYNNAAASSTSTTTIFDGVGLELQGIEFAKEVMVVPRRFQPFCVVNNCPNSVYLRDGTLDNGHVVDNFGTMKLWDCSHNQNSVRTNMTHPWTRVKVNSESDHSNIKGWQQDTQTSLGFFVGTWDHSKLKIADGGVLIDNYNHTRGADRGDGRVTRMTRKETRHIPVSGTLDSLTVKAGDATTIIDDKYNPGTGDTVTVRYSDGALRLFNNAANEGLFYLGETGGVGFEKDGLNFNILAPGGVLKVNGSAVGGGGGSTVLVENTGTGLGVPIDTINFEADLDAVLDGTTADITINPAAKTVLVENNGTPLAVPILTFNFLGGITATLDGTDADIKVPFSFAGSTTQIQDANFIDGWGIRDTTAGGEFIPVGASRAIGNAANLVRELALQPRDVAGGAGAETVVALFLAQNGVLKLRAPGNTSDNIGIAVGARMSGVSTSQTSGTYTWLPENGPDINFTATLTGDITINLTNTGSGDRVNVRVGSRGGFNILLSNAGAVEYVAGVAPSAGTGTAKLSIIDEGTSNTSAVFAEMS